MLYVICDVDVCGASGWTPLAFTRACFDGGARLLQLRAKHLASGALLDLAAELVEAGRSAGSRVIVNDRVDVARLAGAAGVHLGQDDLSVKDARAQLPGDALVGLSTHTTSQISAALQEPISYLAVGPVFQTGTKATGYAAVGLDLVRRARALAGPALPIVAIGGITLERTAAVLEAGATSVAVITDLLTGNDPARRTREYLALGG
ncbi:MAG: thiamine phosphate synthase [Acidimicrobiia bacterium]|nr:thiamine phosphate synthase [Acidimicrobiia bacterium]